MKIPMPASLRNLFNPTHNPKLRATPALLTAVMLLGLVPLHGQDGYWTGAGTDSLWSNADNWLDGIIPSTVNDTAFFGSEAANAPQAVTIDGAYTVSAVRINPSEAQSSQQFTFEQSGSGSLTLGGTSPGASTGIQLLEHVANNVTFNVPLNIINYSSSNWYMRNIGSGDLIINHSLAAGGADVWFNNGVHQLNGDFTGIRNMRVFGTTDLTIRSQNFDVARVLSYWSGEESSTVRFGVDLSYPRALNVNYAQPAFIQNVESGADDRVISFGHQMESIHDAGSLVFLENGPGASGRFILRSTGSGGTPAVPGNGTHTLPMVTVDSSYVRFDSTGTAYMTYGGAGTNLNRAMQISGSGNLWKSNSGTLLVQTENTYTGRSMISGGILRLESHIIGETTYVGQLPSGTLVELGNGATLDLNGIDQTVGGLRGWRGLGQNEAETYGTVQLNGAALTINATEATSFSLTSGAIQGTGTLAKSGAETFTLVGDYTNPADRTLRVENGLLNVDGGLFLNNGVFELAGGQIAADLLSAQTQWNVTLLLANAGATLVNIATTADIVGATLELELGYTPSVGHSFTLLSADAIDGASQGGAIFQYTDGDNFFVNGVEFQIDWVSGSENIMLTVIPEPRAWMLFGLVVAAALFWKRRQH